MRVVKMSFFFSALIRKLLAETKPRYGYLFLLIYLIAFATSKQYRPGISRRQVAW